MKLIQSRALSHYTFFFFLTVFWISATVRSGASLYTSQWLQHSTLIRSECANFAANIDQCNGLWYASLYLCFSQEIKSSEFWYFQDLFHVFSSSFSINTHLNRITCESVIRYSIYCNYKPPRPRPAVGPPANITQTISSVKQTIFKSQRLTLPRTSAASCPRFCRWRSTSPPSRR